MHPRQVIGGMGLCVVGFTLLIAGQHNTHGNLETPSRSPFVPDAYELVFFDEFDTLDLDTVNWEHRYPEGHEYGAGIASHSSVSLPGDGYLHLVTIYEDGQLLTGMIRSVPQFRYGYFEARIQFQVLQGHHGAYWLQSETLGDIPGNPGQSGAEIDIIEFFGSERTLTDAAQNVYFDSYIPGKKQPGKESEVSYRENHDGIELSDDFHIFGLLWNEGEYIFYIDGIETWRTSAGLSHVQEYIILSLTSSEWENGRLDLGQLPDEMLVDYVRVYSE